MRHVVWYLLAALTAILAPPKVAAQVYSPGVREIVEARTMNSRHIERADGSLSAEIHLSPINFKAADGTWQPIDTRIIPSIQAGCAFANETNVLSTYLPPTSDGTVTAAVGGCSVSFRPLGAETRAAATTADGVGFAELWPGASLSYTVQPGELKETITLESPSAPRVYRFAVQTSGLTARALEEGTIDLRDATGKSPMRIFAPWMVDANGRGTDRIAVTLEPVEGGYIYSITPDPEFLSSARYPVVIDPTVSYYLNNTAGGNWTVTVERAHPTIEYYPGQDYYGLGNSGNYPIVGTWSTNDAYRTVLHFADGIPLDADIDAASLVLNFEHIEHGSPALEATLVATGYPNALTTPPSGAITWNAIGETFDILGESNTPAVDSEEPDATCTFDLIDIAAEWTENRALPWTVVLRDTSDESGGTPSHMRGFIDRAQSYLSVTYVPGWYTFQGNRRRTGRTQYAIGDAPTLQWSTTAIDWSLPDGDFEPAYTPPLMPSLIAVPSSSGNGNGDQIIYALIPGYQGNTYIKRIVDTGSTYTMSTLVNNHDITPTGTPLVYNGRLYITGNAPGNTDPATWEGALACYNASTGSHLWTASFTGPVYSSPVQNPVNGGILVAANEYYPGADNGSDYRGRLYCFNATSGAASTGWTAPVMDNPDMDDNLLPPNDPNYQRTKHVLGPPATYSSVAVHMRRSAKLALITESSGKVTACNLSDASGAWTGYLGGEDVIQSSLSLHGDQLFAGTPFEHDPFDIDLPGHVTSLSITDGSREWDINAPVTEYPDDTALDVIATPALWNEHRSVVFANQSDGIVQAKGMDAILGQSIPETRWPEPLQQYATSIFASPLIAAAPGSTTGRVFVADYAANLRVARLSTDEQVDGTALDALSGVEAGSVIDSSMAAAAGPSGSGRFYVLAHKYISSPPHIEAKIYCFAP